MPHAPVKLTYLTDPAPSDLGSCHVQGIKQHVKSIEVGGFFGEVALIEQVDVRAADCIAEGKVKLLSMSRDAFERLMGPADTALAGQVSEYQRYNTIANSSQNATANLSD